MDNLTNNSDIEDVFTLNDDIDIQKKKEIGKRLAHLREEYCNKNGIGDNQEVFGERLGLPNTTNGYIQKTMSNIETGKVVYRIPLLQRYAKLCNVSIDYIINGSDERPAETSLIDFCKTLIKIDRCNLLDFHVNDTLAGISVKDLPNDNTTKNQYIACLMLHSFIRDYSKIRDFLRSTYLEEDTAKQVRDSALIMASELAKSNNVPCIEDILKEVLNDKTLPFD